MRIRPFNNLDTNDAQQVINLQDEWVNTGLLPNDFNRLFDDQFTENNTIVIEMNGQVIGYSVFLKRRNDVYEIDSVFISCKPENKGLGKQLIEFTEEKIKSLGGKKIELCPMTKKNKGKLIKYYQNLGYVLQNKLMEKEI